MLSILQQNQMIHFMVENTRAEEEEDREDINSKRGCGSWCVCNCYNHWAIECPTNQKGYDKCANKEGGVYESETKEIKISLSFVKFIICQQVYHLSASLPFVS